MPTDDPDALLAEKLHKLDDDWRACRDPLNFEVPLKLLDEIQTLSYMFPRHPDIHFVCAALSYQRGETERAQQELDAVFSVQPIYPEAAILRSQIAVEEGNLPFAARFLEQQIRLVPGHGGLREAFAGVLFLRGSWEESENQLAAAERLGAPLWRTAYHRGLVAEMTGRYLDARRFYNESLLERPDFVAADRRLEGLKILR